MQRISAFAETAALMGDPARANMLFALMDGRALTAGGVGGAILTYNCNLAIDN